MSRKRRFFPALMGSTLVAVIALGSSSKNEAGRSRITTVFENCFSSVV